jgi:tripartite-type tricarboxylate transporter receptor subunit TctC
MEASMYRVARRALAVVLLAIASIAIAWAQAYPERPLRLVVGFPPGGSGDFLARIMQHVPFKGGAPSLQAVLAGDVQVMIGTTPVVLPQIRAGRLLPLALITRAASTMVPGVPGMEEAGVPGMDLGSWWGIWAPPRVRPEVKERLYAAVTRVMRLPQVAEKLAREAMEPEISASPEEFAAFVRKDHASYETIVRASGAKAD